MRTITSFLLLFVFTSYLLALEIPLERRTLKGIDGVGVLIEALDPALVSDGLTPDRLRIDVEQLLKKHGLKVLTLDEAALAPGSPALYVCVSTVKTAGLHVGKVEVSFMQAVNLSRDPSVATVAKTWNTESAGAVKPEDIREFRDMVADEVNEFISAYFAANREP